MRVGYRNKERDEASQQEEASLKRVASYNEDHEGKKIRDAVAVYSIWSAAKYTLILSLFLWWLPMFGQMIAGYVGGRKSGGPWRGVLAAILPVLAIFAIITAFEEGLFPQRIFGVEIVPSSLLGGLASSIPFLGPYIDFTREYVGQFVLALEGSSPYGINSYVLTVAFAYIGGIIAEQYRREIEYTLSRAPAVASHTTITMPGEQSPEEIMQEEGSIIPQRHIAIMPRQHLFGFPENVHFPFIHRQNWRSRPMAERFDQLQAVNTAPDQFIEQEDVVEASPKKILFKRRRANAFDIERADRATLRSNKVRTKKSGKRVMAMREPLKRARKSDKKKRSGMEIKKRAIAKTISIPKRKKQINQLRISPKKPKSIRRAHKRIDNEWNQKKKKHRKTSGQKTIGAKKTGNIARQKNQRIINRRSHPKKSSHRNWETM